MLGDRVMPLSVPNSNGGASLSGLLRQTRPAKTDSDSGVGTAEPSAAAAARPTGRSSIDSTQRGTAQITAALTLYLSKLGGGDDTVGTTVQKPTNVAGSSGRSSAADLLRTLDHYQGSSRLRLTG
jgi:hypothetical protein